jgi:hypothetical protein
MQPEPENLKWWWWVIGMLGSGFVSAFSAGVFFRGQVARVDKLEDHHQRFEEKQKKQDRALEALTESLTTMNTEIKARLYHPDGGLIYVRAVDCKDMQANCPAKLAIDGMDRKIDKLIDLHISNNTG